MHFLHFCQNVHIGDICDMLVLVQQTAEMTVLRVFTQNGHSRHFCQIQGLLDYKVPGTSVSGQNGQKPSKQLFSAVFRVSGGSQGHQGPRVLRVLEDPEDRFSGRAEPDRKAGFLLFWDSGGNTARNEEMTDFGHFRFR